MVHKHVEMDNPSRLHAELALQDAKSIFPNIKKKIYKNFYYSYFNSVVWLACIVAAISAPKPFVNGASWAIITRPVFFDDWKEIR